MFLIFALKGGMQHGFQRQIRSRAKTKVRGLRTTSKDSLTCFPNLRIIIRKIEDVVINLRKGTTEKFKNFVET